MAVLVIKSPANPRYFEPTHDMIRLDITLNGVDTYFNAWSQDVHDYGREIYADALAGKYGPVAPYVVPAPVTAGPTVNAAPKKA